MRNLSFLLLLFLSLLFVSKVEGQLGRDLGLKQNYTNFYQVTPFYTLYYGFNHKTSEVNVAYIWDLTGSNLGWMAYAPNSDDMPFSDVWMVAKTTDGKINVWDMKVGSDNIRPVLDSVEDIKINNTVVNTTIVIVEVHRKGNTTDPNDAVISGNESDLPALYAYNPSSPSGPTTIAKHTDRGHWVMNFVTPASITNPVTVQSAFSSTSPRPTSGAVAREISLLNDAYTLSWRFLNTETIEITMSAKTNGWVGFGLGSSMLNADIYIGTFSNGNAQVLDYYGAEDQVRPTLDTAISGQNSVLTSSGKRENGVTTFVFTRRLVTGDARDVSIDPNAQTNIIVAYGGSDALNYHQNRNPYSVNFNSGSLDDSVSETTRRKHAAHGIIMAVSWAIFVPLVIIMSRYFKNIGEPWFRVHVAFGLLTLVLVIIAFAIGVSMVEGPQFQQKDKVRISHAWIGLFVFIFVIIQVVLGFIAHKMWSPERTHTPWFPDRIHHWIGRISFLSAIVNIFLGISSLNDTNYTKYLAAYGAWVGVLLIVFVVLEVMRKKKSN
eukprot:TRINITY_DN4570_c0_g1_i4.p1 TRINITY_DN4570_c0_g1~~TRINITY_DN4570_c0_g1_i4.p1  ORF type:complete len:548 (+),score=121.01 TRINITY_DN4570_c0_g1_i4:177-1820(+)